MTENVDWMKTRAPWAKQIEDLKSRIKALESENERLRKDIKSLIKAARMAVDNQLTENEADRALYRRVIRETLRAMGRGDDQVY